MSSNRKAFITHFKITLNFDKWSCPKIFQANLKCFYFVAIEIGQTGGGGIKSDEFARNRKSYNQYFGPKVLHIFPAFHSSFPPYQQQILQGEIVDVFFAIFGIFLWLLIAHSTDFVICHMTYGFLLLFAFVRIISYQIWFVYVELYYLQLFLPSLLPHLNAHIWLFRYIICNYIWHMGCQNYELIS